MKQGLLAINALLSTTKLQVTIIASPALMERLIRGTAMLVQPVVLADTHRTKSRARTATRANIRTFPQMLLVRSARLARSLSELVMVTVIKRAPSASIALRAGQQSKGRGHVSSARGASIQEQTISPSA
jgi:hypothetical protein